MSAPSAGEDAVTVSSGPVTVEKTLERVRDGARVSYAIATRSDRPVVVRVLDPLPDGVATTDVTVPEEELSRWTIDGSRLVFEDVVPVQGSRTTGYFLHDGLPDDGELVVVEPDIASVEPADSADGEGQTDGGAPVVREAASRDAETDEDGDDDVEARFDDAARSEEAEAAEAAEAAAADRQDPADDEPDEPAPDAETAAGAAEGPTPAEPAGERLSTGIDILDRHLEGGIPPGRIVALVAPPDTQGELLLQELVAARDTLYLSTVRPRWEVEEHLEAVVPGEHELDVEYAHPEDLLADPSHYLDRLGEDANLILDSVNGLESEDRDRYLEFLNLVKQRLYETGGVAVLHGFEDTATPAGRGLTLNRADLTWELRREADSMNIETQLVVSKFRGGTALTDPVKLVLTDEVEIDTSRDIA